MEYGIKEVSKLAGVSARTLRYYDEIGLLKPASVTEAGYRLYHEKELDLLQQILFYRERKFSLKQIRDILYQDGFDIMSALEEHLRELEKQKKQTDNLILTIKRTMLSMKGEYDMSSQEKLKAFQEKALLENEKTYGEEIRKKYGDEAVDGSYHKIKNMTEAEYQAFQSLETDILSRLETAASRHQPPESDALKEVVALHKRWLSMVWKSYTAEAHKALAGLYVSDSRFQNYYDRNIPGCAELLEQAVRIWADRL